MLYTNDNGEVILEITTEDGYKLTPNYNHSAYVCYGLLEFSKLVFYNDFKQGHFDDDEGVHFTVTQTIGTEDYYQTRIPKVFEHGDNIFTLDEDGSYWNHDDTARMALVDMLDLRLDIQIECWTCTPDYIENHPIISTEPE